MNFGILFVVLAVLTFVCAAFAMWVRRPNRGYIFLSIMVFICDISCYVLLESKGVDKARIALSFFYIVHSWIFFGLLWLVAAMDRYRLARRFFIPVGALCLYQNAIIISNFFGTKVLSVSKHIMLGSNWWVAGAGKSYYHIFGLGAYRALVYVIAVLIMIRMALACVNAAPIFRIKFIVFIVLQVLFIVLEAVSVKASVPVWVGCIAINLVCIGCYYLVNRFSSAKLRDWSLSNFANDLSDGFMLYDEYDDPIHMNDLMRRALPAEMVERLRVKANLDKWLEDTVSIEGIEAIVCENEGNITYFRVRVDNLGERLGTIYILHDTTDTILRLQAMKKVNVELERTAKMKSDFLANMSHEIRTPMNAVIGMAEIALREDLPDNVKDYLKQIQGSGRNLLNIINDILDFSKIEAGKMEILPEEYEPISEINDIAGVLMTRIGDKNLEFFVNVDTNIPAKLYGDVMRIRQVLINLANNAIKFTKEGMVEIRILSEPVSDELVNVIFHVIDTGQGIKEEDLDKLFVSFQQVDSKRNRSVEGTGLGLAISQKLCEAMGGYIGVESTYGVGSDFYFMVPQKVLDPQPAMTVEDIENKRAFCMDDKPDVQLMFMTEMEKLSVEGGVLGSPAEYVAVGKKDYLFFDSGQYGDATKKLLDENPGLTGIILVDFDSDFRSDRKNLRVLHRPENTASMVLILNDRELKYSTDESDKAFVIDFTAPEARILIVDDNAINITIAQGLLEPIKAQCDSALSGKEAIEKIKNGHFDLVFMDHMMPEMDGCETTQIIRETIPEMKDTPILALSANVMEEARELFRQAGMTDFVAKPIDVRALMEKVKQHLPADKIVEGAAGETLADQLLPDFDCLDTQKALKALGSPQLYQKIVKEYYRAGESKHRIIQDAFEHEDWETYAINTHALKSSSRQIGAFELGDMAEEMEKAGKEANSALIAMKTMPMLEAFDILLHNLEKYFPEDEARTDLPLISEEELSGILAELSSACEELDMDGMEAAKEKLEAFSFAEEKMDDIRALKEAIDNIDIDSCSLIIGRL